MGAIQIKLGIRVCVGLYVSKWKSGLGFAFMIS